MNDERLTELKRLVQTYIFPHKKYPFHFVQYPEVNLMLDMLPECLEEILRLKAEIADEKMERKVDEARRDQF